MNKLGIELFIQEQRWKGQLEGQRLAFLGNMASVSQELKSSLGLILSHTPLKITCVFGPQHGFKNVEQANMITTKDAHNTTHHPFPVLSLYSEKNRRLNKKALSLFDTLIVDLQDVGCRVYTYLTSLFYVMEDCARAQKALWILDRPNPAGRKVEGSLLNPDFKSFVGAAPMPIRHGLTLGEAALWYRDFKKLNLELSVVKMQGYSPEQQAWPKLMPWVLPSPNMVDQECARCYSGTVLLEGTNVSEARGTVFPLKAFGVPGMPTKAILKKMGKLAPNWLKGLALREVFFQPVFDKHQGQTCEGLRIYATKPFYQEKSFSPYRLVSLFLKCLKLEAPDFDWLKPPPYEYEYKNWPIDILSGDDFLRRWVEDKAGDAKDLEQKLLPDETLWKEQRKNFLLY